MVLKYRMCLILNIINFYNYIKILFIISNILLFGIKLASKLFIFICFYSGNLIILGTNKKYILII